MAEEKTEKKIEDKKEEKSNPRSDLPKEEKEKAVETKAEKKEEKVELKEDVKPELEREYVIPLRKKVQKVPRYKRANKAIKVIREFLVRHMKVEDRDLNKVKIDKFLNQEIWFRGIKKPCPKIKVKAVKKEGIVYAELAEIPEKVKWDIEREKKKEQAGKKVKTAKKETIEEKVEEAVEEEKKEKQKATAEAGLKSQKAEAKEIKHTAKIKQEKVQQKHQFRKALKK